jgi:predicted PurR-regulated permease PerM
MTARHAVGPAEGRLASLLERRASWIDALIVLATIAAGFVVLAILAAIIHQLFHLALIFILSWVLASLISPVADVLQHRLRRLPRAAAVTGVVVPVIVIGALVGARLVTSIVDSFASLADALPGLAANPPAVVTDAQSWLAARGIAVDVDSAYRTISDAILAGLGGGAGSVVVGAAGVFGTFADALTVITLAIFMAVDRERILQFGVDLMPERRRPAQALFRKSVGAAFSGFLRSQLIAGAAYGLWALVVSLVFGLPFAIATAFLTGLIMSIPIYGPYVSWLPPVVVAVLIGAPSTPLVVVAMVVGWFVNMNFIGPLVRSDQLQVNPIVVTFAFLLGAQLEGPIGAILAIPIAAVVQAFFVEYRDRRRAEMSPAGLNAARGLPAQGSAEAAADST